MPEYIQYYLFIYNQLIFAMLCIKLQFFCLYFPLSTRVLIVDYCFKSDYCFTLLIFQLYVFRYCSLKCRLFQCYLSMLSLCLVILYSFATSYSFIRLTFYCRKSSFLNVFYSQRDLICSQRSAFCSCGLSLTILNYLSRLCLRLSLFLLSFSSIFFQCSAVISFSFSCFLISLKMALYSFAVSISLFFYLVFNYFLRISSNLSLFSLFCKYQFSFFRIDISALLPVQAVLQRLQSLSPLSKSLVLVAAASHPNFGTYRFFLSLGSVSTVLVLVQRSQRLCNWKSSISSLSLSLQFLQILNARLFMFLTLSAFFLRQVSFFCILSVEQKFLTLILNEIQSFRALANFQSKSISLFQGRRFIDSLWLQRLWQVSVICLDCDCDLWGYFLPSFLSFQHYLYKAFSCVRVKVRLGIQLSDYMILLSFLKSSRLEGRPILRAACSHISDGGKASMRDLIWLRIF